MSGTRAQKQAALRSAMLDAAARLFERQGYARTTFTQIAAAARCGEATLYKYFGNKEGIVVAILLPSLERTLAAAERVVAAPPPDPADAMVRMLSQYRNLGGRDWASREILRLTVFPGLGNDGLIGEFVRSADERVEAQIRRLLETQQRHGRLAPTLRVADAARVVFALLNQHFGAYLADGTLSFTRMFRSLERTVRLVFDDWRAPAQRGRGA